MMNSKIQAVIKFNRREEIRKKIGQYTLLILLVLLVITEVREIIKPHIIFIEVTQASENGAEVKTPTLEKDKGDASTKVERADSHLESASLESLIRETFPEEPDVMLAIAKAESRLDNSIPPNQNRDKSWDTGIFRINSVHGYSQEYLSDIHNNIKVARKIYDTQGKNAWVTFWNGDYKKYL